MEAALPVGQYKITITHTTQKQSTCVSTCVCIEHAIHTGDLTGRVTHRRWGFPPHGSHRGSGEHLLARESRRLDVHA